MVKRQKHVFLKLLNGDIFDIGKNKLNEGIAIKLFAYTCKVSFQLGNFLKIILIHLILNLFYYSANSQIPNWQWAKHSGGNGSDYGNSVAIDASGNVFVLGYFSSNFISFNSFILNNNGNSTNDFFLVKYDFYGNVLWAKSFGGLNDDFGRSVTVDALDNIIIVGDFLSPTLAFDSITLTNATSAFESDIFIAKFDSAGNILFANNYGGTNDEHAYCISVDKNNYIYFTGDFWSSSLSFDSITLINNTSGFGDIYIVKIDPFGTPLWAKSSGGNNFDEGDFIVNDDSNNVYIGGSFRSPSLIFGSDTLINSSSSSGRDVFLAKYDSHGNVLWAKSGIAIGWEYLFAGAADTSGSIIILGQFDSPTITFDSVSLTNSNSGSNDIFLVKYDRQGNLIWARSMGGISDDVGNGVKLNSNGDIFITGSFNSSTIIFDTISLSSNGNNDIFLAKYNRNGHVLWAINIGGNDYDEGQSIALGIHDNVFISGYYRSSQMDFGSFVLSNGGNQDMFIARLCETFIPTITLSGDTLMSTSLSRNQWYMNDSLIPGDTLQKYLLLQNGNYFVVVTDSNGCSAASPSININNVGIIENELTSFIVISPNPSNGFFSIKSDKKISDIEITNTLGENVYSMRINSDKIEIDLSNKPLGIYFVQLIRNNETFNVEKLIITN